MGPEASDKTPSPHRVLEALWELLLQAILQALGANHDASADFYERFHFTLEVGGACPALPFLSSKVPTSTLLAQL